MLYDPKWNTETVPAPTFGRRWHSWSRLDIRPVLWSLRNRPEEWQQTEFTLLHKPSRHEFWTANGFFFYALYRADGCSCTRARGGAFSLIQKFQFGAARRRVARMERARMSAELIGINAQFAGHFLPTAKS